MRQAMTEAQQQREVETSAVHMRLIANLDSAGQASLRDALRNGLKFWAAERQCRMAQGSW
jgi:hypothetical protein